jgi:ketosteroid isomerase-like protein
MYASIVAGNVRSSWRQLNARDHSGLIAQFAPSFRYEFFGIHALGGVRHSKKAMEKFFTRIFNIFPNAQFEVSQILVKGMPWNTTVVALVKISATLANGQSYQNQISQTIRIRWGRIVEIMTLEDTQKLVQALQVQLEAGIAEAGAAPIIDE